MGIASVRPPSLRLFLLLAAALACGTPARAQTAAPGAVVIDMHAHIRFGDDDRVTPTQPTGVDPIVALNAAAGVSRSALIVIAPRGDAEATRRLNDRVIAIALDSGGRFIPVVSVHPLDGEAAHAELARVAAQGVRIVKLHPNTQNFDVGDSAVHKLVQRCGELGLVVLIDSYKPWDANHIGKLLMLSMRNPKTRFILAHMGASEFRQTAVFGQIRKLGRGGNVWFDLSAIATNYADSPLRAELVWTMRTIGIDRMLFGSDWPVDTPAEALAAVRALGLTSREEAQVLGGNAVRLLELAPAP